MCLWNAAKPATTQSGQGSPVQKYTQPPSPKIMLLDKKSTQTPLRSKPFIHAPPSHCDACYDGNTNPTWLLPQYGTDVQYEDLESQQNIELVATNLSVEGSIHSLQAKNLQLESRLQGKVDDLKEGILVDNAKIEKELRIFIKDEIRAHSSEAKVQLDRIIKEQLTDNFTKVDTVEEKVAATSNHLNKLVEGLANSLEAETLQLESRLVGKIDDLKEEFLADNAKLEKRLRIVIEDEVRAHSSEAKVQLDRIIKEQLTANSAKVDAVEEKVVATSNCLIKLQSENDQLKQQLGICIESNLKQCQATKKLEAFIEEQPGSHSSKVDEVEQKCDAKVDAVEEKVVATSNCLIKLQSENDQLKQQLGICIESNLKQCQATKKLEAFIEEQLGSHSSKVDEVEQKCDAISTCAAEFKSELSTYTESYGILLLKQAQTTKKHTAEVQALQRKQAADNEETIKLTKRVDDLESMLLKDYQQVEDLNASHLKVVAGCQGLENELGRVKYSVDDALVTQQNLTVKISNELLSITRKNEDAISSQNAQLCELRKGAAYRPVPLSTCTLQSTLEQTRETKQKSRILSDLQKGNEILKELHQKPPTSTTVVQYNSIINQVCNASLSNTSELILRPIIADVMPSTDSEKDRSQKRKRLTDGRDK